MLTFVLRLFQFRFFQWFRTFHDTSSANSPGTFRVRRPNSSPWGAFLPYSKIRALFFHLSIRAQRQTVLGRSPEMGLVTLSGSLMYLLLLSATASPWGPSRASVCRRSAAVSSFWGSPCLVLALPW